MPANKKQTAAAGSPAPAAAEDEPSFENALERLETIVEELEGGSLTLEQSLARYEEGMRLSRRLTQTLDQAEKRIERLVEEDGGGPDHTAARARPGPGRPRDRGRGRASVLSPATAPTTGSWLEGAGRAGLIVRLRRFEGHFARVLPPDDAPPARLHAAMRYAALGAGKRLRPLLALTACEAVGGSWMRALPAAAAIECVHAFSLVHDDLPCMDDDDYRRGRLTTHKKFGDALALLAGDALLALAFEELTRLDARGVPAARVADAVRVLGAAAGSRALVGGQVLDLEGERRRVDGRGVREIHLKKTGGLVSAALVLGGLAGGASPGRLRSLARMGHDLGLAFQIHDDLLNRGSSLARLGKRAGTDEARRKATYPRAVGVESARAEAARLFLRVLRGIERIGPGAWNLGHLIIAVAERDR